MIYCVTMMSGEKIALGSMEEVVALVNAANDGAKLVVTRYGVVNVSSIDSITPFKEKMSEVAEITKYGKSLEEAEKSLLGKGFFTDFNGQKKLT